MDISERIGLLPHVAWLADRSFVSTMLAFWLVTPIVPMLLACVFESRWLPLRPSRQFLSFFPGDLFLGVMMACLFQAARELPGVRVLPLWFHVVLQVVTIVAAVLLWNREKEARIYPPRAMRSPTKLYHDFVLYSFYGYVAVATIAAIIAAFIVYGTWPSWWTLAGGLLGLVWAMLVAKDSTAAGSAVKARFAHIEHWKPILRR